MSAFVSGRDATPFAGFEGAMVLDKCRGWTRAVHDTRAELQIALHLCSPCRMVMTLRLYGKSIAQYTSLSRTGCSKSFSDLPLAEGADTQGYQVADEEINMSLADFKGQYANNGGTVEWAVLQVILPTRR